MTRFNKCKKYCLQYFSKINLLLVIQKYYCEHKRRHLLCIFPCSLQDFLPFFFKKDSIYLFLEREGGREEEREKCQCARDTLISCLSLVPN